MLELLVEYRWLGVALTVLTGIACHLLGRAIVRRAASRPVRAERLPDDESGFRQLFWAVVCVAIAAWAEAPLYEFIVVGLFIAYLLTFIEMVQVWLAQSSSEGMTGELTYSASASQRAMSHQMLMLTLVALALFALAPHIAFLGGATFLAWMSARARVRSRQLAGRPADSPSGD